MVSKDLQQIIMQAQTLQQQLQMVMTQREAINLQLIETGKALEELRKPGEDDVYRILGPVLIKVKRAEARKDLESKKELLTVRMKSVDKSEASLKQKLEDLKEKLSKAGV